MMPYPRERKTSLELYQFEDLLLSRGYTKIGESSYGRVWTKPGSNWVIKTGNTNADNYIHYVRAIGLRSENRHLPYIRSVRVYDPDQDSPYVTPYYVIVMERLEHQHEAAWMMNDHQWPHTYWSRMGFDPEEFMKTLIPNANPPTAELIEVKGILTTLFFGEFNAGSDIRPTANVMWRTHDGSLDAVFTDPIV